MEEDINENWKFPKQSSPKERKQKSRNLNNPQTGNESLSYRELTIILSTTITALLKQTNKY